MSEKIDLTNQSLKGLHILLDYCRSNNVTPNRFIEISNIDKNWFERNKQYINLKSLSDDEEKRRDKIIKKDKEI